MDSQRWTSHVVIDFGGSESVPKRPLPIGDTLPTTLVAIVKDVELNLNGTRRSEGRRTERETARTEMIVQFSPGLLYSCDV
ncbi:hypothetical protein Trydic_g23165 [Trypoxylus dichotomus]